MMYDVISVDSEEYAEYEGPTQCCSLSRQYLGKLLASSTYYPTGEIDSDPKAHEMCPALVV